MGTRRRALVSLTARRPMPNSTGMFSYTRRNLAIWLLVLRLRSRLRLTNRTCLRQKTCKSLGPPGVQLAKEAVGKEREAVERMAKVRQRVRERLIVAAIKATVRRYSSKVLKQPQQQRLMFKRPLLRKQLQNHLLQTFLR